MRAGQQPGENAGVGCVGNWTWRKSITETNSFFRQSIERRRLHLVVSIAVNVIRSKSINRDEKNVGGSLRRRRGTRIQPARLARAEDNERPKSLHRASD